MIQIGSITSLKIDLYITDQEKMYRFVNSSLVFVFYYISCLITIFVKFAICLKFVRYPNQIHEISPMLCDNRIESCFC